MMRQASHPLFLSLCAIAVFVLLAGCATVLGKAVEQGDAKSVNALLDQGMDVNEKGACGWGVGETPLFCAVGKGDLSMAKLLIERGADLNAKLASGMSLSQTPLIFAVQHGNFQMVQLLLDRGAQFPSERVLLCDRGGLFDERCTLVQYAQLKGDTKIVRLLEQAENRELAKLGVPSPALPPGAAPVVPVSDVDSLPATSPKVRDRAYAVVIGIEQYQQALPKADFAAHDAEVMGQYLSKVLGYPEENVVVLLNERATKTGIEKYVEAWLPDHVEKDDAVFIYYSGHGAPNAKTGKAYLVPYDGDPAFVEKTSYPLDRLYEYLANLPAREVVVMLDSCFSGAGGRSVIAKGMRPMVLSVENPVLAKGKTVVLAASSGEQVSSTYIQKGHGLLTYFFLKGLQGEADQNKDRNIELTELFEYLRPQVERVARREFHNEQKPQLLGNPELLRKGVRLREAN